MNKFLWILGGATVMVVMFILGWWYGEKKSQDTWFNFLAQTVENEGATVQVLNRWSMKIFKLPVDNANNQPIGLNTSFVECPWSKLDSIDIEVWLQLPPKLYDGASSTELNFFGYSLNFLATSATKSAKFIKAVRKNSLSNGQCIYWIFDGANKLDSLIVYDIKLIDACVVKPDVVGGFSCDE